jgi:predicted Rossmann-fold nucleotide-binding protein
MFLKFCIILASTAVSVPPEESVAPGKEEKITVALLGSDRNGTDKNITLEVKKLAKEIDPKKVRLIYNGGNVGLRYFFVQEFTARGGEVKAYTVPNEKFKTPATIPNQVFPNDSQRMQQVYNDSDLFLVLPGGMETIGEMGFVVDQNASKDRTLRPLIVFDVNQYYSRFFQFIEYVEKQGFMDHKRLFRRSVKQESQITKVLSQIYFESKKDKNSEKNLKSTP